MCVLIVLVGLSARAQVAERPSWGEGELLDYALVVRTSITGTSAVEHLEQRYMLRLEIRGVDDDGMILVGGRVFDARVERSSGDGSDERFEMLAGFSDEGAFELSGDDGGAWGDALEALLHTEFVVLCVSDGQIVQLSGLDRPLGMLDGIPDGLRLFGALRPEVLASHLEPVFTLDGGFGHEGTSWESRSETRVGDGRQLVRAYRWERSGDGSYEGAIDASLETIGTLGDLSPRGTLDAYEGEASLRVDEFGLRERTQIESMAFLWRVDSIEVASGVESRHELRRLESGVPALPEAVRAPDRSQTLRMGDEQ